MCLIGIAFSLGFALYLIDIQTHLPAETASYIIDGDTFKTSEDETIRLLCVDILDSSQGC